MSYNIGPDDIIDPEYTSIFNTIKTDDLLVTGNVAFQSRVSYEGDLVVPGTLTVSTVNMPGKAVATTADISNTRDYVDQQITHAFTSELSNNTFLSSTLENGVRSIIDNSYSVTSIIQEVLFDVSGVESRIDVNEANISNLDASVNTAYDRIHTLDVSALDLYNVKFNKSGGSIGGNTSISGNLYVVNKLAIGSTDLNATLDISGDSKFRGDVNVAEGNDLIVTGNAIVNETLRVDGSMNVDGSLNVNNDVSLSGVLYIGGENIVDTIQTAIDSLSSTVTTNISNLDSTITGTINTQIQDLSNVKFDKEGGDISGDVTITDQHNLTVTGNAIVNETLIVDGSLNVNNDVSLSGVLYIKGENIVNTIQNAIDDLSGSVATDIQNLNSTITGTINTQIQDLSNVKFDKKGGDISGDVIITDQHNLTVTGNVIVEQKIDVSGSVTFRDGLDMSFTKIVNVRDPINAQDATTKGYVDVSLNLLDASLKEYTDNSINLLRTYVDVSLGLLDSLKFDKEGGDISGDVIITDQHNLTVTGNTTVNETLMVDGSLNVNNDVSLSGVLYIGGENIVNTIQTAIDDLSGSVATDIQNLNSTITGTINTQIQDLSNVKFDKEGGDISGDVTITDQHNLTVTGNVIVEQDLDVSGSVTFRDGLDMSSSQIVNVGNPINAQDATTKGYVDVSLGLLRTYVDGSLSLLDASLQTYTDNSINLLRTYVDGSLDALDASLQTYVDNSINLLRTYVDGSLVLLDASLQSYTDASINLLKGYVDGSLGLLDASLQSYTDASINLLKGYVDGSLGLLDASLQSYTDNSINLLKGYVDGSLGLLDASLQSYTDNSINLLRTYVDGSLDLLDLSLQTYTDNSINLLRTYVDGSLGLLDASLQSYTDASINLLRTYVDGSLSLLDASLQSYTDISLSNLRTYVDGSLGLLDASLQSYTDASINLLRTYVDASLDALDSLKFDKDGGDISGDVTISDQHNLTVTGNVIVEQDLDVSGNVDVSGSLEVKNGIHVMGTIQSTIPDNISNEVDYSTITISNENIDNSLNGGSSGSEISIISYELLNSSLINNNTNDVYKFINPGKSPVMSEDGNYYFIGELGQYNNSIYRQGALVVLKRNTTNKTWDYFQTIKEENSSGNNRFTYDTACTYDGGILVVGVPYYNTNKYGRIEIFKRDENDISYSRIQTLDGSVTNYRFGESVSINDDGSVLIEGSFNHDNQSGRITIFSQQSDGTYDISQNITTIDGDTFATFFSVNGMGSGMEINNSGERIFLCNPGYSSTNAQDSIIAIFERNTSGNYVYNSKSHNLEIINDDGNHNVQIKIDSNGDRVVIGADGMVKVLDVSSNTGTDDYTFTEVLRVNTGFTHTSRYYTISPSGEIVCVIANDTNNNIFKLNIYKDVGETDTSFVLQQDISLNDLSFYAANPTSSYFGVCITPRFDDISSNTTTNSVNGTDNGYDYTEETVVTTEIQESYYDIIVSVSKRSDNVTSYTSANGELYTQGIRYIETTTTITTTTNKIYTDAVVGNRDNFIKVTDNTIVESENRWITFGKETTTGNNAALGFTYNGANDPSNRVSVGFVGNIPLNILNSGNVGIGTDEPQTLLDVSGSVTFRDGLDMSSSQIVNVRDPINAQDATTKGYVDGSLSLLDSLKFDKDGGDISGDVTISDQHNLTVTGDTTINQMLQVDGSLNVDGSARFTGDVSINGVLQIGNNSLIITETGITNTSNSFTLDDTGLNIDGENIKNYMDSNFVSNNRLINTFAVDVACSMSNVDDYNHSLVLLEDGRVKAFGENSYGQLGDGTETTTGVNGPVDVSGISNAVAIAAGKQHSLVLLDDGQVKAFGNNGLGRLGDGNITFNPSDGPVYVKDISNAVAISVGGYHSLVLLEDGQVKAFGRNTEGQLGDGNTTFNPSDGPVYVKDISNAVAIAAGYKHSLVLLKDGQVKAFGLNNYGQLGDGTIDNSNVPVDVSGLTDVSAVVIAAGNYHSLVLLDDGTVKAFGYNGNGQLGNGTIDNSNVPVDVIGLTDVSAVAAGGFHSLVLLNDGTVKAFGYNGYGQLGDGNTTFNPSDGPVYVKDISNAVAIAAGRNHSLVVLDDGTVKAFGLNNNGQLGDGTIDNSNVPVDVSGIVGFGLLNIHSHLQVDGNLNVSGTVIANNTQIRESYIKQIYSEPYVYTTSVFSFSNSTPEYIISDSSLTNTTFYGTIPNGLTISTDVAPFGLVQINTSNKYVYYNQSGLTFDHSGNSVNEGYAYIVVSPTETNAYFTDGSLELINYSSVTNGGYNTVNLYDNNYTDVGNILFYSNESATLYINSNTYVKYIILRIRANTTASNVKFYMTVRNTSTVKIKQKIGVSVPFGCTFSPIQNGTTDAKLQLNLFNDTNSNPVYINSSAQISTSSNFTGQHHNYSVNEKIGADLKGFIVISTGTYKNQMDNCNECNKYKVTINESLPIVDLSKKSNDKKVFGVISDKDDNSETKEIKHGYISSYKQVHSLDRPLTINSLGEGAIWVCNVNGAIENGDYITSSPIPGLGMIQNDDLLHNYTVAKSTMNCEFSGEQVPRKKLRQTLAMIEVKEPKLIQKTQQKQTPMLDDSGNIVIDYDYDYNGNTVMEGVFDESGNPVMEDVFDESGNPVMVEERDSSGNIVKISVYDESGNILMIQDTYANGDVKYDPVVDEQGNFIYDFIYDDSGNQLYTDKYESKYVEVFADKFVIYNDEEKTQEFYTYEFDFANGAPDQQSCVGNTYVMAFIGCTYHCG